MSTEKLRHIAVSILLFPSICFTITQLHGNSFIHNISPIDVRCVLNHLIECDLLECINRGLKTSRRSTSVYVKRLPHVGLNTEVDDEHMAVFAEKLSEFGDQYSEMTIEEYIKKSSVVNLDASGTVTDELMAIFCLPEYAAIDLSPLRHLMKQGRMFY